MENVWNVMVTDKGMKISVPLYATLCTNHNLYVYYALTSSGTDEIPQKNWSIAKQYKRDANKGSIVVTDDVERDPTEALSCPLRRGCRTVVFLCPVNHMPAGWKKRAIEICFNARVIERSINADTMNHGKYVYWDSAADKEREAWLFIADRLKGWMVPCTLGTTTSSHVSTFSTIIEPLISIFFFSLEPFLQIGMCFESKR